MGTEPLGYQQDQVGIVGRGVIDAETLAEDIRWSVSDCDFDVALHLVFENRAAHDAYQDSPQHQRFLEENEGNWKAIRVFDAYVGQ